MQDNESVIRAFSAEHVVRLTGLSKRQLQYWDKTDFFHPRLASENRKDPFSRIYSFQDVVGLKTLGVLRNSYKIPLQHLRKVAAKLCKYRDSPWSQLILYVFGKEVYFNEPDSDKVRSVVGGQYISISLKSIIEDVAVDANKLRERSSDQYGQVSRHRYIAHNAWVIAGTRIPINSIRRFHAAGYSTQDIIKEYPTLNDDDVKAAIEYVGKSAKVA